MLNKAKSKLFDSVEQKEDLKLIQRYLINEDVSLLSLSMYEICNLWCMFSEDYCAGFLVVDNSTLNNFKQWIKD